VMVVVVIIMITLVAAMMASLFPLLFVFPPTCFDFALQTLLRAPSLNLSLQLSTAERARSAIHETNALQCFIIFTLLKCRSVFTLFYTKRRSE
jgi:hypothetical protein